MSETLDWGVIGTGGIASDFAEALAQSKKCRLVSATGSWTATANVAWLQTTASGTGNGLASFTFLQNTGATRSGTLTVAGETLTITQAGTDYSAANPIALADASSCCGVPLDVLLVTNLFLLTDFSATTVLSLFARHHCFVPSVRTAPSGERVVRRNFPAPFV